MNNKNKKYVIVYAPIILIIGAFFYWLQSYKIKNTPDTNIISSNKMKTIVVPEKSKSQTTDLLLIKQKEECEIFKKTYADLVELKKLKKLDLRFKNTHKQIEQKIYRLRHFFKDGDEGNIATFLVYLEESEENASIIEKKSYTKGKLFQKIEKSKGQILYHEEGFNLSNSEHNSEPLFLHYINNQLISLQGALLDQAETKNIDCHF